MGRTGPSLEREVWTCPSKPTLLLPSPPHTQPGSFCLESSAVLLLLSLLLPLGLPVLGAPQHLICDSRVLERYILEAKEAENVTVRPPPWDIPQNSLSGVQGSPPRSRKLDSFQPGTWFRGGGGKSEPPVKMIKLVASNPHL